MNFQHIPETETAWGFYTVVVIMLAVCAVLYWRFEASDWL